MYLQELCRYRLLKIEDCFNFLNKQKILHSLFFFFLKMSLLQFINSEIFFVISVTLLYAKCVKAIGSITLSQSQIVLQ